MTTILILLLAVFFISGAPLFTIMLGVAAIGTLSSAVGFEAGFDAAVNKLFGTSGRDEMEVLSTIPLFIYAGYLLAEAKTADRLVRFANAMLGWMPGGLAIVTIGTCALFTVFTGASGVTIIALGGVLMPALVRNGYPERFSLGLIAGTGSVGLLFPPALPLFIYGTVYGLIQSDEEKQAGVWATERFLFAGVIPGLVLIGMLCLVAMFVAIRKKLPRQKFVAGELGRSFLVALPELFIPFGVVLALAKGFGLPEIAALTVVYVAILEIGIFRTINLKQMWGISYEAMAMIGAIFMIILASTALTNFMVDAEVPKKLVAWTQENVGSKIVFLLAINVILLIVGTVMDIFSAIVVVLPLIAPISRAYGIDPYHLGVIFLLNLEVGYLHPPVGLNLFLTSVKFQRPITEVMWATIPFLITMIIALFVITYVPQLTAMSVPDAKRTDPIRNLTEIAENGVYESKVSITEITLVDAGGGVLKGADGKPIVRRFLDCRPKKVPDGPDGKPGKLPTVTEIQTCQELFFAVTKCMPNGKTATAQEKACANKATADWTVTQLNNEADRAIIVVSEVPLVDETGKPLEHLVTVLDSSGKPVMDGDDEKKAKQPIVGKDGKPIVKKLAECGTFKGFDREECLGLFIGTSNCKINFDEPAADCLAKDCPADKLEECKQERTAICVKEQVDLCVVQAINSWVEEYPARVIP